MTNQVKLRRGTTAQHSSFIGVQGELTYDTDLKTVRIHDGSTAGGRTVTKETDKKGLSNTWFYSVSGDYTWTKPSDLTKIRVTVCGAGGGGANGGGTSLEGGGGGAGGLAILMIDASLLSSTVSLHVGAGGAGGTTNSNGSTGETSTFGSFVSATGGSGGVKGDPTGVGAAGGSGTGGAVNLTGGEGETTNNRTNYYGLKGANGLFLGSDGGLGPSTPGAQLGSAGKGFGSGGGGGAGSSTAAANGGAGAGGFVMVEEFYGPI